MLLRACMCRVRPLAKCIVGGALWSAQPRTPKDEPAKGGGKRGKLYSFAGLTCVCMLSALQVVRVWRS